jgi:hypothetical protein
LSSGLGAVAQAALGQVRVPLSHDWRRVPEHALDFEERRARLNHVRSEGVAQIVDANAANARPIQRLVEGAGRARCLLVFVSAGEDEGVCALPVFTHLFNLRPRDTARVRDITKTRYGQPSELL